jgi:hypothetical protein
VWDNKGDMYTEIETIADNIDKQLNKKNINNEEFYLSIYRNTPYRLMLDDPSPDIQRRQLRYIVKVYYK